MEELSNKSRRFGGDKEFTLDRVVRLVLAVVLVVGIIWLLRRLHNVLLPFLVAWFIAYMLEPIVQYNSKVFKIKRRFGAVFLTLAELLIVLTGLGFLFVPAIIDQMHTLALLIHDYAVGGGTTSFIPPSVHDYLRNAIDFEAISSQLTRQDLQSILNALSSALAGGVSVILSLLNWVLVILYVIFIMLDYEKLLAGFKAIIPQRHREKVLNVLNDMKDSMNRYFRGQALVAFIVGILFAIGFAIVGLPMGIVLGLFIGVLNLVPYLQLVSLIPTTILCIICTANTDTSFWLIWWECMAVYVIVQCIQDLFLTPKIMGNAMGLNPALILLSLSVWGSLLGFVGLIIALPLTTLLISYYNRYLSNMR